MTKVQREYRHIYAGGAWRPPDRDRAIAVVNPATGDLIATIPAAGERDVAAAVAAARAAADGWAATPAPERAAALTRLRDGLARRRDEIALTIATDVGSPLGFAGKVQADLPIAVAGSYADLLGGYEFAEKVGNSLVYQEPVGVAAAITPWNYPLHQMVAKVAPALAAGCPVVLKPAEDAPLVAFLLADAAHEAGLPPGVFNLVPGTGPDAGAALVVHPDVDIVSFTGSTAVGREIGAAAGHAVKRVALELGGKSANVILPGADLVRAVNVGVANVMANSGQTCSAWTRMLVHRDDYDRAVEIAAAAAAKYAPGDPLDPATRMGPVVSARQRDRVRRYIEAGVASGARLVAGGAEAPNGLDAGFFVQPTVFADVDPASVIAQEEIFGPVLCVIRYEDEAHAVEIANGTPYGLAGAVWAGDDETAVAFARRMRTGQVDINGGRFNPLAPFGGYNRSGVGRELGRHGLAEYLVTKSLQF